MRSRPAAKLGVVRPTRQGILVPEHAAGLASLDLFVVRAISFKLLYGLVILHHARRRLESIKRDEQSECPMGRWAGH